jgi:hypothetical protein
MPDVDWTVLACRSSQGRSFFNQVKKMGKHSSHKRSTPARAINCIKMSGLTFREFAEKSSWWRISTQRGWGKSCEKWLKDEYNKPALWFWKE